MASREEDREPGEKAYRDHLRQVAGTVKRRLETALVAEIRALRNDSTLRMMLERVEITSALSTYDPKPDLDGPPDQEPIIAYDTKVRITPYRGEPL